MRLCLFRLLAIALLFACTTACSARAEPEQTRAATTQALHVDGLPNLHQVAANLYRSAQPDRQGMRNAEAMGIGTVINLRALHDDTDEARGTALKRVDVPVYTGSMTSRNVIDALRAIRAAQQADSPVLVHCMHGADRTGTVIAFYRIIFENWSREQAKEEMLHGGYGFHSMWDNLPRLIDEADIGHMRQAIFAP